MVPFYSAREHDTHAPTRTIGGLQLGECRLIEHIFCIRKCSWTSHRGRCGGITASMHATRQISIGENTEMRKTPTLNLRGADHEEYGETWKGELRASLCLFSAVRTFEEGTCSINRHLLAVFDESNLHGPCRDP